jgi:hypothetical protein
VIGLLIALAIVTAPVPVESGTGPPPARPETPGAAGTVSPGQGYPERPVAPSHVHHHYRFKHHHECQTLRCARHADRLWWELHVEHRPLTGRSQRN